MARGAARRGSSRTRARPAPPVLLPWFVRGARGGEEGVVEDEESLARGTARRGSSRTRARPAPPVLLPWFVRGARGGEEGVVEDEESSMGGAPLPNPTPPIQAGAAGAPGEVSTVASSSLALRPRASSSSSPRPLRPSRAALPAPRLPATRLSVEHRRPVCETTKTTRLYSLAPYPLLLAALLPGAETVTAAFQPFVELVQTFSLPDWLVHWGHPGNMAVVLFAMGGYGTYLGFRIKMSDDPEEKAKAKDLHPKLLGGMFFFFALGATGGVTALLTSNKPIFESPHAVTGIIGLALLTVQSLLPTLFEVIFLNPVLMHRHIYGNDHICLDRSMEVANDAAFRS